MVVVPEVRELKAFYDGAGQLPDFNYARFYWPPGNGPRESVLPRINKKRQPVSKGSDCDTAARVEALVPFDAPEDYVDPNFLARRYEETLAADEANAYAQLTLRFPASIANLHHPYEVARQWLRSFYSEGKRIPLIAILHAPWRVACENPVHLHAIVFPKTLGRFGWLAADREVASDAGAKEAFASWQAFKADRL
ncbi:MAG TPA: hypothetical protein VF628_10295 [Allosphingosinicella sp.]